MANYKDTYNGSNIQFNSVNVNVLPRTKSIGNKDIVDATSEDLTDIAAENGGKLPSTVNAVEIDWNGAQVSGKTLNTTGEVLSLINDNNTDIENVASSLRNHSHTNYATKSYVTEEIKNASISGGSGLDMENFTDTSINYNLLVAPEGAEYTTIGSLDDTDKNWTSQLYANVDQNGNSTLFSTRMQANYISCSAGNFPHTHSNYATTSHSHSNYKTSIENLEDQITYLTSRINDLEELIGGGGSVTPTIPQITGVNVKVTGGIYGTTGKTGTLDDHYEMRQFDDGTSDTLNFVLTANPSNAGATLSMYYDDNAYGDINDTLVTVSKSQITNGLNVTVTERAGSVEWVDGDWTRYKVEASNSESNYENSLFIQLSYVFTDDTGDYFYVGQTEPTASNYKTLATQITDYPSTYEYQNTSGSRGYAYVILHNSKTLTAIEKVSQATVNFTTDSTSIPGYKIYKSTAAMAINGVMVITIK